MKIKYLANVIAVALFLTGCTTAPVRDDARIQDSIGLAGVGTPRLPVIGESYLDDAWFAEPLTVGRAVQAALLNNPLVSAELSRLDIAQAELIQAGLLSNPILDFMALRPNGGGRFELDYVLMQSLFDLVTRTKRIDVANAAQARVQAEVMMSVLRVVQDAKAAYVEVMAAKEALRFQREQSALEENTLVLLKRQAQQGALSSNSVLSQQAAVSMQAHALRTAEAEQTKALSALAQLLGLPSIHRLVMPDQLPALPLAEFNESEMQVLAMKHRPELMVTIASVDQARAEKKLQVGALRAADPSLGLAGTRESSGMSLNGLSAQISLPIFDTGRARSALADAKITQAQYQAESTRRLIPLEVERALATLIANTKALEHADHHLRQQQQLEKLATRNYQQGIGDYLNLAEAKRLRLASQMEQLQAQQMLLVAYVDLERATGVAMQNLP
jgi:cobalt-zinc-cadmium efflux system outer membrane protein